MLIPAGGCRSRRPAEQAVRLAASTRPYLDDIPVPDGFTLVERSSEEWSNGTFRYVRHRYRGRADEAAVRAFYRREMPLVRWSLSSERGAHGRYTMRFSRGDEICTVEIHEASGLRRGTLVDVVITPAPDEGASAE